MSGSLEEVAGSADGVEEPAIQEDGEPILRVENLRKQFGGILAVDGVSFAVEPGTMTGLIGPNGAGKSTTFNLITGVTQADSGQVIFEGEDVTGLRTNQIANRGLVRTFQIARELEEMTLLENVMLAPPNQLGETIWRSVLPYFRDRVSEQEADLREQAWETLEFFDIDHLATEPAGSLSGGQRKLLEMARVFMTDPDMVLLDEPLAGVNPTLEDKILDSLHSLREEGHTFLLVSHDMDVIMNNADPIVVMHQGQKLVEGSAETVKSDQRVLEAYLGGEVDA